MRCRWADAHCCCYGGVLGAMIYDVLAVALTDSLPTDTILAAIITATILTVSCNGEKYKDLLR